MEKNAEQRLRDRKQPEYTQAKGHNKRVRDLYPEAWAESTITDRVLADWVKDNKSIPCPYCGNKTKEIDHVIPLSKSGQHSLDNLQMLCLDCNRSKGDKLPEEFKAWRQVNPVPEVYRPDSDTLRPNGRYRTKSLFTELSPDGIWSLEEFKRLYLTIADPTEYQFAVQLLGSWKHWQLLSGRPFMRTFIRNARAELSVLIRSRAALALTQSENVAALKMLATERVEWLDPTESRGAGRPTKPQETLLDDTLDVDEDRRRIGLN
jgi:5-methylcytosine-specific restriction endonuclease McrA